MVDPGRYSHRRTPVPRSERRLKSGLSKVNGAAAPAPSGSMVYPVTDPLWGSVLVATVLPLSLPKKSMRRDFTSANSLKLVYLPLARNGCANISRVRLGVYVMFTRVSIENVFCWRRPNTYRVPAKAGATVGSAT